MGRQQQLDAARWSREKCRRFEYCQISLISTARNVQGSDEHRKRSAPNFLLICGAIQKQRGSTQCMVWELVAIKNGEAKRNHRVQKLDIQRKKCD
jgi:hypothetical protein